MLFLQVAKLRTRYFSAVLATCAIGAGTMPESYAGTFLSFQIDTFSTNGINEYISDPNGTVVRQSRGGDSLVAGVGSAQFGVLKSLSIASWTPENRVVGQPFARVLAGSMDFVRFAPTSAISGPAVAEVMLQFDRALTFSGDATTAAGSYATAGFTFSVSGGSVTLGDHLAPIPNSLCDSPPGCAPTITPYGSGTLSATWVTPSVAKVIVPVAWNLPMVWALTLETVATATSDRVNQRTVWTADAANSLYWGGISRLVDAQGNAIDFNVTSESGTDYRQSFVPATVAIPLPPSYLLMAFGLAALALARARREKNQHGG